MMRIGTWEDVIGPEEADAFVGRTQELASFREAILQDRPGKLIFYISGQGGAGKTALLKRYQSITREHRFALAESDELQGSVPSILGRFAAQLKEAGHDLEKFNEKYRRYQQLKIEIEADVEAPQGLAAMIGRTAVNVGLTLIDEVPIARQGAKLLPRDALVAQGGEWASYLARKLGNRHDEVALMGEPVPILTRQFFDDLNNLADNRRFLLCFDNYEFTRTYLDDWMARLREYKPSWNIRLVVAGRTEPGPAWEPLSRVVQHIRLDVFSEAEAGAFLDRVSVTDSTRRQEILDLSGRLPVLMSWLASAQGDDAGNESPTTDVVERFLRWVKEPSRRRLALLAAAPRRFDLDVLACLRGAEDSETLETDLDWLQEQPWVRQREDGWHYHAVVRRMMLRYQRRRSERAYRGIHKQLADWYERRQVGRGLSGKAAWEDDLWRLNALERIYHGIIALPDLYWGIGLDMLAGAFKFRFSLAQDLMALATDPAWSDELTAAQHELLNLVAEESSRFENNDLEAGARLSTALIGALGISDEGRSSAFAGRGDIYRQLSQYEQALTDLNEAIALGPNNDWIIARRGLLHRERRDYDRALVDFDKAIALDPKYAWAIAQRGLTYREQGAYDQALIDFNQAIELNPSLAWAIVNRGIIHRYKGEYNRALADFDRAITLDEQYVWAIAQRGENYRLMGKHEQALADFDRAVALNDKYLWAIAQRGVTYREQGAYDQALADFNQAIELDPNLAWVIVLRGIIHRFKGEYDQALANFDQAITLDSKFDWAIGERGAIYLLLGQYDRALADFDQGIILNPKAAWTIANRGLLHLLNGKHSLALADLDRAIALKREHFSLTVRALAYRILRQEDAARRDLAEAIVQVEKTQGTAAANWADRLDLALYHMAAGNRELANATYQKVIDAGIAEGPLREQIVSLDVYLRFFPEDDLALEVRNRLRQHVEDRFPKSDKVRP